jgi:hypothetical protein
MLTDDESVLKNHESDNMNEFKREWMIHAGMLHFTPHVKVNTENNTVNVGVQLNTAEEAAEAIVKTGIAIAKGAAISQIDGPLPFADVVGLGIAVIGAGIAWWDFFDERI